MLASHNRGKAKLLVWSKNCKRARKKARQGLKTRRKNRQLGLVVVGTKCLLRLHFGVRFDRRAHSRDPRRLRAAERESPRPSLQSHQGLGIHREPRLQPEPRDRKRPQSPRASPVPDNHARTPRADRRGHLLLQATQQHQSRRRLQGRERRGLSNLQIG